MEVFTYEIDGNWNLLSKDESDSAYNVYVYAYNKPLATNEQTTPLFTEVTLVNLTYSAIPMEFTTYIKNITTQIGVFAYAIQSDGTGTAAEAWVKYCNQNAN